MKSLTISPKWSRYQFSDWMYLVLCSTTCPNRCTRAGSRGGRCVALVRRNSCPKLKVCGCCAGSSANSCVPGDHANWNPVRIGQVHRDPTDASGRARVRRAGRAGEPLDIGPVSAANAGPANRDRGPRRMITQGEPASVPRS